MIQMLHKETPMDRLAQDSILCSYLWNGTTKDTLILMAYLYSTHQKKKLTDPHGTKITQGVIEYWENEVEGLKSDQDSLNEFYRQFPRTTKHAFRDESKQSLFNLTKIYQQIDFNEDLKNSINVTRGSFQWENAEKDTKVIFIPNNDGRFLVTWVPPANLQNKRYIKNGTNYPGNEHCGAFGCDPYDISGHCGR